MTEKELAAQLKRQGFSHIYIWEDEPYKRYPDHKHPLQAANVVLNGEVTTTVEGKSNTYRAGDRCDIPANTVHSAMMDPRGCRYLVGER